MIPKGDFAFEEHFASPLVGEAVQASAWPGEGAAGHTSLGPPEQGGPKGPPSKNGTSNSA